MISPPWIRVYLWSFGSTPSITGENVKVTATITFLLILAQIDLWRQQNIFFSPSHKFRLIAHFLLHNFSAVEIHFCWIKNDIREKFFCIHNISFPLLAVNPFFNELTKIRF